MVNRRRLLATFAGILGGLIPWTRNTAAPAQSVESYESENVQCYAYSFQQSEPPGQILIPCDGSKPAVITGHTYPPAIHRSIKTGPKSGEPGADLNCHPNRSRESVPS